MPSLKHAFLAFRELGWRQSGLFGLYRLAKLSGFFRLHPRPPRQSPGRIRTIPGDWIPAPAELDLAFGETAAAARAEMEAILNGQINLFGAYQAQLDFSSPVPLRHWSTYGSGRVAGRDIKFYWEPARFGWAVRLARAYLLTGDSRCSTYFYRQLDAFMQANPPYQGLHWSNGQEVALRLVHLILAHLVFGGEEQDLIQTIRLHAARLPATLSYARAQNNNHLLSEAAALLTAGVFLADDPGAPRWRSLGWRWLNAGIQQQISDEGIYVQQSTNYHRLMLQLALWGRLVGDLAGLAYPPATLAKLAAATRWLWAHTDPASGTVPNLGPNDGAWILPLVGTSFYDHRPVVQAAAGAFLDRKAFPAGTWDELALWMHAGQDPPDRIQTGMAAAAQPTMLQHPRADSRMYLRAVHFNGRPGHADQLHADLWWRGQNIAMDAGTFLYTADAPWDNALQRAFHHNTVVLEGKDQMTRAGRFLYVRRAQAHILEREKHSLAAEHDGYREIGMVHRRRVQTSERGWLVQDSILPARRKKQPITKVRLHWLLPDFPFRVEGATFFLETGEGKVEMSLGTGECPDGQLSILRAGKCIAGDAGPDPAMGWHSPTYAVKVPALSIVFDVSGAAPIYLETNWSFPP